MTIYRIIETHRTWGLFRQASDNPNDLLVVSIHETKSAAEAARVELWREDSEAAE